jgi:SNF2 family DNA or RNA helicase
MRIRSDLRNYQRAGVAFIKEKRKCALFVDMGLGKTAMSLTVIADLSADLAIGKTLVVAPKRVARKVWTDEARAWNHTKGMTFANATGSLKSRQAALRQSADITLVTTDLVKWLLEEYEGKEFPFDVVFVDESSKFKHKESARSKALRILTRNVRYVVLLTGTPSANGLHDLWAQIFLIDRGERLGHTLKAYRERYFHPNWDGSGYKPMEHAQNAIQKRISDICFTLRSEDYLELPERIDNPVYVDLPDKVLAEYKKFAKQYVLNISEQSITAVSAGALYQKLLQCANGRVYDAERNELTFHEEKVSALEDIVDEAQGDNILVAYNFKSDIPSIQKRFPDAVVLNNDMDVIDRWNRGEIRMLLAHPQSAGHGLNLQFGGGTIVWYGLTWNLENYLQFNKRIHRHGQTRKNVIIHHLIAKGTIDETVMQALHRKDKDQNALLDALKGYVKPMLEQAG